MLFVIQDHLFLILLWLVAIKFCQITIYPYLKSTFGDNLAYGVAYPCGMLLYGLITWYFGLIDLPIQWALLPFGIAGIYALSKKEYVINDICKNLKWDGIFISIFFFVLLFRYKLDRMAIVGSADGYITEQYMDAAFLGSIMNNPGITPMDPWFAHGTLEIYYYLGHWIFGAFGVLTGGGHTIIYNFIVPTVAALSGVVAYAIGTLLLKRHHWLPLIILILPNAAFFWYFCSGLNVAEIGFYSSHLISGSWNPYPLFTFIGGGPHAHLLNSFNQLLFIFFLTFMFVKWSKLTNSGKSILIGVMALSLGSMPGIHTHDVLIYALAYIAIAGIIWYYKEQHDITKIYYFISIPILSLAIYSPLLYYMLTGVGSSIHGISLVTSPTTITEYLGIYLLFIIIIVIYTLNTLKTHPWILLVPIVFAFFNYGAVGISLFCIFLLLKNRNMHFETIVAIIGFCVLIAMDIIYLNDFTGTRCNTVYKFVYIAWFLLGISSSVMAGRLLENHLSWLTKKRIWACIIVILVCLFIVPVQIGGNINHSNESLDGSDWIKHANRGDYEGIHYLRENANPKDIIVEAVSLGGYEGRISVMTGLSTVLGWAGNGHEGGWRIGTDYGDEVPSRIDDVKKIYENSSVTVKLMDKYGAKYLIVGDSELKMYNVSLPSEGIENVFSYENMTIIQRIK